MTGANDAEVKSDWRTQLPALTDAAPGNVRDAVATPDRRDGAVYVMDDALSLAVDVALATGRPLLLRGEPGSGKSSLAAFIARNLDWRYYEHVITARAKARDLLYTFDSVRKLSDASSKKATGALTDERYIEPGVFWWAFDRQSALRRGVPEERGAPEPAPLEPDAAINASRQGLGTVVLIDEIDKADPDLPNGLLVPLGSGEFRVLETGVLVSHADGADLLVIVTTNEERELPPAFLRRCVTYRLGAPDVQRLVNIGWAHLRSAGVAPNSGDDALVTALAQRIDELREDSRHARRRPPSTAEFLDAVRACRQLRVAVGDNDTWRSLEQLVLLKDTSIDGDG